MRRLTIGADLSIESSEGDTIHIKNEGNRVLIDYHGKSVPIIPFKWLSKFRKLNSAYSYLEQSIHIRINDKDFYLIKDNKGQLKDTWTGIRIFFTSIFKG